VAALYFDVCIRYQLEPVNVGIFLYKKSTFAGTMFSSITTTICI